MLLLLRNGLRQLYLIYTNDIMAPVPGQIPRFPSDLSLLARARAPLLKSMTGLVRGLCVISMQDRWPERRRRVNPGFLDGLGLGG